MPRRDDIHNILVIGSGPIVIGQACEFDYSGTQAIKALREEGYRVVLVNSNPATIMTDPEFSHRTYIEPITPEVVEQIIARERPDALLPTLGGQTALNVAVSLAKSGVLERYGVKLIGASLDAIETAEDRLKFRECVHQIGLSTPKSGVAHSLDEARRIIADIGFPAILRPAFTMGGSGGAIAYNQREFPELVEYALSQSPVSQVLIEESVLGWKEFELEVVRDRADNVVIICSIENFDPMGVHTGDSITVAPAMTLTDKELQRMRDAALKIIRAVGVDTGGSNIQFGQDPRDGRLVVIEMNPRVSRSSALASKATGFPIARIAAKLAVGYTLDELPNEITQKTKAAFEPALDYVVVKIPRFAFEKFPGADDTLTTQMKSVGEAMAIGRTFCEALQKAVRSLENKRDGLVPLAGDALDPEVLEPKLSIPGPDRLWHIADAFRLGMGVPEVERLTRVDPWFLEQVRRIVAFEGLLAGRGLSLSPGLLRRAKELGFSDARIASLAGTTPHELRALRLQSGIAPVMKRVDTCAAEFVAFTPYFYSSYEEEDETEPTAKKKIVILGCGPNRIGQGIEFDYCCVHGALALREEGFETVMVNCNPETVSTDFDISDRLYFEPLTLENVLDILAGEAKQGADIGVLVQFGGQTPLSLAQGLAAAGVKIIGTSPDAIDQAEDRERFSQLLARLRLRAPAHGTAKTLAESREVARTLGYPVLVRPSYVLGGRAMEIVYDERQLEAAAQRALEVSNGKPLLLDAFLRDAIEIDVDAVCDGHEAVVAGIMEHVEEAGIHSGDSSCCLPPYSLDETIIKEIKRVAEALALGLGVVGLINIQLALKGQTLYVLEVNPRASRTVPFVSKATGVPWAKIAAKVMAGKKLHEFTLPKAAPRHFAVKGPVFPFKKFHGVDPLLGPEMRSTGEVMGISGDFWSAFAKAEIASGVRLPKGGRAFVSVKEDDKGAIIDVARRLRRLGFEVVATRGTARVLRQAGVEVTQVNKVREGRPHILDRIFDGEIHLICNTTLGVAATGDSRQIRRQAILQGIPYYTTLEGAMAVVGALERLATQALSVQSLQEYFPAALNPAD